MNNKITVLAISGYFMDNIKIIEREIAAREDIILVNSYEREKPLPELVTINHAPFKIKKTKVKKITGSSYFNKKRLL